MNDNPKNAKISSMISSLRLTLLQGAPSFSYVLLGKTKTMAR